MSEDKNNTAFTEKLIDSENVKLDFEEGQVIIISQEKDSFIEYQCSFEGDTNKYAIKVFKNVPDSDVEYDKYKDFMSNFLKLVTSMSTMHHKTIAKLVSWNIVGKLKDLEKEEEKDSSSAGQVAELNPFIITPKYFTFDEIFGNFKTVIEYAIFIYGCLRGFRHMNSFNFFLKDIKKNKIFFERVNGLYCPIINDFDNDMQAKGSDQLKSFGQFLDDNISNQEIKHVFDELISKLKSDTDPFPDFHMATLFMENQIIPKIAKDDTFSNYKDSIDDYESKNFVKSESKNDLKNLEEAIKQCGNNKYKIARTYVKLARTEMNQQAAFRAAISYYVGDTLSRDLALCFVFLRFSIKDENSAAKFFMNSLSSIRKQVKQVVEGDELVSDEVSLFYDGAYYESKLIEKNPEENPNSIGNETTIASNSELEELLNTAISKYRESLEKKANPEVMGRLGALLTKYSDSDGGPALLKKACEAQDVYGMVNYGLYLLNKSETEEAVKIFEQLKKKGYPDAAITLAKVYKNVLKDDKKAQENFDLAYNIYGNEKPNSS